MTRALRLDTHVVVWLFAGEPERLTKRAIELLESSTPVISPLVQLELTYLHEIGRISVGGSDIVGDLSQRIGLQMSDQSMISVVHAASSLTWTRDPFDRMIVADALAANAVLLTKDGTILANSSVALWQ